MTIITPVSDFLCKGENTLRHFHVAEKFWQLVLQTWGHSVSLRRSFVKCCLGWAVSDIISSNASEKKNYTVDFMGPVLESNTGLNIEIECPSSWGSSTQSKSHFREARPFLRRETWSCVPKRYVKVLTPGTCECGLFWRWGLCRCNQGKINSNWIRVVPDLIWRCSYTTREIWTQRHTENATGWWAQRPEGCVYRPSNTKNGWQSSEAKRDKDRSPPEGSERVGSDDTLMSDF